MIDTVMFRNLLRDAIFSHVTCVVLRLCKSYECCWGSCLAVILGQPVNHWGLATSHSQAGSKTFDCFFCYIIVQLNLVLHLKMSSCFLCAEYLCATFICSKLCCGDMLLNSCCFDSVIALWIFQHDIWQVIKLVLIFRAFLDLCISLSLFISTCF